jgi:hypothetical protein
MSTDARAMSEMVVKPLWLIPAVLGLSVVLTACTNPAETKENLLSSSGFKAMPPTTPAQIALLKSLPPHKLAKTTYQGQPAWAYADPTLCGCVYVGNQDAYNAYVKNAAAAKALDASEAANARAAMISMDQFGSAD